VQAGNRVFEQAIHRCGCSSWLRAHLNCLRSKDPFLRQGKPELHEARNCQVLVPGAACCAPTKKVIGGIFARGRGASRPKPSTHRRVWQPRGFQSRLEQTAVPRGMVGYRPAKGKARRKVRRKECASRVRSNVGAEAPPPPQKVFKVKCQSSRRERLGAPSALRAFRSGSHDGAQSLCDEVERGNERSKVVTSKS